LAFRARHTFENPPNATRLPRHEQFQSELTRGVRYRASTSTVGVVQRDPTLYLITVERVDLVDQGGAGQKARCVGEYEIERKGHVPDLVVR